MSDRKTETSAKRRRFSEEIKQAAVRLVVREKYSFEAAAVDVSSQTLRHWHARLAPKPAACGEEATLDERREDHKRLPREHKQFGTDASQYFRQSCTKVTKREEKMIATAFFCC